MEKRAIELAKGLVDKFAKTIGSNCEHDSYCDKAECHKLSADYAFCSVDYEKAEACALIAVEKTIEAFKKLNPSYEETHYWHPIDYYKNVKTAIQKPLNKNERDR